MKVELCRTPLLILGLTLTAGATTCWVGSSWPCPLKYTTQINGNSTVCDRTYPPRTIPWSIAAPTGTGGVVARVLDPVLYCEYLCPNGQKIWKYQGLIPDTNSAVCIGGSGGGSGGS